MQINKSMILTFSIFFILLIGLTTINATDNTTTAIDTQNTNINTQTDSINKQIDTVSTTTIQTTTNTTKNITKNNNDIKSNTLKESSTENINTNNIENPTNINTYTQNNEDESNNQDKITTTNNQNTNIQTTNTVNKKEKNNSINSITKKQIQLKTASSTTTYNWYVNTTGGGDGKSYDSPTTLTTAVNSISDGQSIFIKDGIYNLTSTISINDININITGESTTGTILSGQNGENNYRIIEIMFDPTVNITNITFANGISSFGGAISNPGTLNIINSNFINNIAKSDFGSAYGGAIYNTGTLTIINSSFINNTLTIPENDVESSGGAIYNQGGTCTIKNSSFINNILITKATATVYYNVYGGAIANRYGTLTVTDSIFVNNTISTLDSVRSAYGGAISNDGTCTITNSSFINNTAIGKNSASGGAIYTLGTCTVTSSSFINNTAIITIETHNYASSSGAIYNQGTCTVTNSSFINNIAITKSTATVDNNVYGGAIANRYGTLTVINSSFINNTVTTTNSVLYASGGAIYNGGTCTVINSSFINNTATEHDGASCEAIYNEGTLTVIGSIFINNTATAPRTDSNVYVKAIYNNGNLTANYNIFLNNKDNEGIEIYNDALYESKIISLDYNWWGHNITNYQSSPYILGLTNYHDGNLTNWLYLNLISSTDKWTVGNPSMLTTSLTGYSKGTTTGTLTLEEAKKLPQNITVTYTTDNGIITDNTLLINGISTAEFTPTTETSIITSYIYTNSTRLSYIKLNIVYVNATATTIGTGESWNSPVITIQDALGKVSSNGKIILAEGKYNVTGDYGLTIAQNINITGQTQNKVIIDGLKTKQIITITTGYNVNITNITFTNGKAEQGGAINNQGTINITNSSFINNTAITGTYSSAYGGAIYNNGNLTVIGSSFINNTAIRSISNAHGGAIYNTGIFTANYNVFINNKDFNNYEIYNSATVSSLDYNWWGQNTTDYQKNPFNLGLTNHNSINKWLYLNITSSTDTWTVGNPIILATSLTRYSTGTTTGTITTEEAERLPQNITVTYTTDNGIITENALLINGISKITYKPISTGSATITTSIYTNSTTLTKEVMQPNIIYVNASATIIGTGESWNSPVITIQDALDRVSESGTIILAEGKYNVTGDYGLTIAQNINITGQTQNKVIIDGLKTKQIITITTGYNVNITNITFTNGKAEQGGAINNQGTITITNSSFINNTATGTDNGAYGGAIYNMGICTINGSSFINNTVTTTGTGNYAHGGAILNGGTFTLINSNFINNTATTTGTDSDAYGGAISNGDILTIKGSNFNNNIATTKISSAFGGAISNGGTLNLADSNFINNTATTTGSISVYGGAVYNDYGIATITGSNFINNTVITTESSNAFGGAITNKYGTLTANYNIFINNTNINNYEIYNDATISSLDYNWWGHNTTNYQNNPNDLKLTNYNSISNWLYLNITSTTDTWTYKIPTTLTTNLTGYYTGSKISTLTTEQTEKLPQNIPVTYTTNNGIITDNTPLINGISTATYTPTTTQTATVTTNIFINSTSLTKEVTKLNTVYVNATAKTKGTGESWNSPLQTIQEALDIISDNSKIILAEGTYDTYGDYTLTINKNINITGQTQNKIIIDGSKTNQIMTIISGHNVNITNIIFTNGKAQYGGAINNLGILTITNSSFINNSATTEETDYIYGGAICNSGTLTITGSSFINNTATTETSSFDYGNGGAIYNMGTLTVNSSSFINNTANKGGAIYNIDTLTAEYNIFLNNTDANNYEIHTGGTIKSLDYNWWGHNTTNYQNSPDSNDLKLTNYNNINNWLYLNMTSSQDKWTVDNIVILTANLTGYYISTGIKGILTTEQTEKLPQNIPVTYTVTTGTINDNTSLINGISTATYTPNTAETTTVTASIYTNYTAITKTVNTIDTTIKLQLHLEQPQQIQHLK